MLKGCMAGMGAVTREGKVGARNLCWRVWSRPLAEWIFVAVLTQLVLAMQMLRLAVCLTLQLSAWRKAARAGSRDELKNQKARC
jgi:hypothetical protein